MGWSKFLKRITHRAAVANVDFEKANFPFIDVVVQFVTQPNFELVRIARTAGDSDLFDLIAEARKQFKNGDCSDTAGAACDENF